MRKAHSISLLALALVLIMPWSLMDFCIVHPLGHDHHEHEGPSTCQQRSVSTETCWWPPMECHRIGILTDDFRLPECLYALSSVTVSPGLIPIGRIQHLAIPTAAFIAYPKPRNNSDPPEEPNPLRGPPIT